MIILDTNVISELMRQSADSRVIEWMNQQAPENVWTTSVTLFEIYHGIEIHPNGKRKRALRAAVDAACETVFKNRVLSFDSLSAEAAAGIANRRRKAGLPSEIRDLEIAGIVSIRRATLATRNMKDFAETGIALTNPWDFEPE